MFKRQTNNVYNVYNIHVFYNFRPCRLPGLQSHLLMKSLWISSSWICIKKKTSYFIDGAKQDNILTTAFKAQKGGAALEEEVVDLQLQVREQRSMLWAAPLFNFCQPHTIHASTELDGPRARPRGSQSGRGFFFSHALWPLPLLSFSCHIKLQLYKLL